MLCNICVFDGYCIVNVHALDQFSCIATWSNGWSTAKSLKNCFLNCFTIFFDFDLELHHVTASWSANKASSNIIFFLVEWSHISRVFVVINDSRVIGKSSHGDGGCLKEVHWDGRLVGPYHHCHWILSCHHRSSDGELKASLTNHCFYYF